VISTAISPDSRTLVSCSEDKTVRLWDAKTGTLLRTMRGHTDEVSQAAFTANGARLVSGSFDGSIHFWDVRSGRLVATLLYLESHENGTPGHDWLAFTPESYYVGSPEAERFIAWQAGDELRPAARYKRLMNDPDVVQQALR
jgi:WD40 repeat protein